MEEMSIIQCSFLTLGVVIKTLQIINCNPFLAKVQRIYHFEWNVAETDNCRIYTLGISIICLFNHVDVNGLLTIWILLFCCDNFN